MVMKRLGLVCVFLLSGQGCAGHDSSAGVQGPESTQASIDDEAIKKPADSDGDTLPDANDKCPNEAETFNGVEDGDGCLDVALVKIKKCPMVITVIVFNKKGVKIQKQSELLIEQTAAEIIGNPKIRQVLLLGKSSEMSTDEANIELSSKRAHAVLEALSSKGVAGEVLVSLGIGSLCAVSGEKKLNDLVEIRLLEIDEGCVGCPFICDKAASSGLLKDDILKYIPESEYCKSKEKK